MQTQQILIPIDDSPLSREIVPQIRQLFDPARFSLTLLRVAEPVAGLVGTPPRPVSIGWTGILHETQRDVDFEIHPIFESQVEASERDALEQSLRAEQHGLQQDGYQVGVEVRFGDPAQEIVSCAAERGAALIAMATHGRTGWRRVVLGSVAEQVLRTTPVPVLLVRPFAATD
jgi:nucleotide-binding universal stress UspA family protein